MASLDGENPSPLYRYLPNFSQYGLAERAGNFLSCFKPHFFDHAHQRSLIRKIAHGFLGMDELAIDFDFKDSSTCGNQRQILYSQAESIEQLGRQTDGLRRIVSHHAEGDLHVHCVLQRTVLRIGTSLMYSSVDIAAPLSKKRTGALFASANFLLTSSCNLL